MIGGHCVYEYADFSDLQLTQNVIQLNHINSVKGKFKDSGSLSEA